MKINHLSLKNFRGFEHEEINLNQRFTLLIGDNGSGKSAILDAIAIILKDCLTQLPNIHIESEQALNQNDLRFITYQSGQTVIKEPAVECFISAQFVVGNDTFNWKTAYPGLLNAENRLQALIESTENPNIRNEFYDKLKAVFLANTPVPMIAYFSTSRLWQRLTNQHIATQGPNSRFSAYQDCLNPTTDLTKLLSWFKTQELAAIQKRETRNVLESVRLAIISMIPDATRVWWDLDWDELLIEYQLNQQSKISPFSVLSDGYRNLIGIAADIAYRMATLNPHLEAEVLKKTGGIVLIDELDLHLHPKWQRLVVTNLLKTFPKLQLVASSHSPFIIQSLYHNEETSLWDLEQRATVNIDSKSIEDIAEFRQGVEIPQQSQRFLDMQTAAEAYYQVLAKIPAANEQEAQVLKQRLDELLLPYSDDPAFSAFLKMEKLAMQSAEQRHAPD